MISRIKANYRSLFSLNIISMILAILLGTFLLMSAERARISAETQRAELVNLINGAPGIMPVTGYVPGTSAERLQLIVREIREIGSRYRSLNQAEKIEADARLLELIEALKNADSTKIYISDVVKQKEMLDQQARNIAKLQMQVSRYLEIPKEEKSLEKFIALGGFILALLVWLGNMYFAWRKDGREAALHEREVSNSDN